MVDRNNVNDEVDTHNMKVVIPEIRDIIVKNFAEYNLEGMGLLLSNKPGSFMFGDFLINCAMNKQWTDTVIRLFTNDRDEFNKFIKFFTERGYTDTSCVEGCLYMFVILSNNPEDEYDTKYPHITMELTNEAPGPSAIHKIVSNVEPENIYYDGEVVCSDMSTGMLQRGTVLINHPERFEKHMNKYKDRDVNIVDDINSDVAVKSARKD